MSHANNDEIRGVLIQSGPERVLLPNATVAEVLTRAPVEPVADDADDAGDAAEPDTESDAAPASPLDDDAVGEEQP